MHVEILEKTRLSFDERSNLLDWKEKKAIRERRIQNNKALFHVTNED